MKFITVLLLALSAFCGFDRLAASTTNENNEQYFTCSWTGTEENLFFTVQLSNEFAFDDDYVIREADYSQECEIVCRPKKQCPIFSSDGFQLQKITITVMVKNTENPYSVGFTTTEASVYQGTDNEGALINRTSTSTRKGFLTTPAIDLTREPDFFDYYEDIQQGVIAFTHSQIP